MTTTTSATLSKKELALSVAAKYLTLSAETIEFKKANRGGSQIASHIMNNMKKDETLDPTLHRKIFMHLMTTTVNVTDNYASTYYANLKAEQSGTRRWSSNLKYNAKKSAEKRAEKLQAVGSIVDDLLPPETPIVNEVVVETPKVEHKRWRVVNKSDESIIDSFTSRDLAQKYNAQLKSEGQDVKWVDGDKKVA